MKLMTMGSVYLLRQPGAVIWHAAIGLGIGDDDTVSDMAESNHPTEMVARTWIERTLPGAKFPDWVARRPHGVAGAFLFGSVTRGYLVVDDPEPSWEPDLDAPSWDVDLIDGAFRWHKHR